MLAKLLNLRFLLVGAAMVLAVGLSFAIEPPKGGKADSIDLKKVVPEAFGEWSLDPQMALVVPSPDVEAGLAKVYQQTLSRTYMNPKGERMMLSIAYTGDIDRQTELGCVSLIVAADVLRPRLSNDSGREHGGF